MLFDHMRTGLAVNTAALGRHKVEALTQTMRGQIKAPWSLEDEATVGVSVLMLDPPKRARIGPRDEERILRGTRQSGLARKIRAIRFGDTQLSAGDIPDVLKTLLHAAKKYGLVEEVSSPVGGIGWRLIAKTIHYRLQTGQQGAEVTNRFFAELYTSVSDALAADAGPLFGLEGREHTAQVEGELRELREFRFRYGEDDREKLNERQDELKEHREGARFLPALFCSPTMELGVDISSMNVVYLRNAPPTAANYAQRGGRAGRSGQAALIMTYCAAQSPHDQYFFERMQDLVDGVVVPPSIDLRNWGPGREPPACRMARRERGGVPASHTREPRHVEYGTPTPVRTFPRLWIPRRPHGAPPRVSNRSSRHSKRIMPEISRIGIPTVRCSRAP